jgi:hypothetical protein
MKLNRKGMIASLALVIILLMTTLAPVWAQQPITRIRNAVITTLSVPGAATVNDFAASYVNFVPPATIAVTMNATITPLGAYQPLSSAGTVNTASITVGAAGDVLTLVNIGSNSIVLTDTGTLKLSGNLTLGANDSVVLQSDGTNWNQLSTSNN